VVTSTPLELAVLLGGVVAHDASEDVRWVLDSCARLREQTGGAFDERAAGRLDPSELVKGWAVERGAAILRRSGASGSSIRATAGRSRWLELTPTGSPAPTSAVLRSARAGADQFARATAIRSLKSACSADGRGLSQSRRRAA